MGLIKKYDWKGWQPEYWFITEASQNVMKNKTIIGLALYKDKATRELDKNQPEPSWENMIGRQNYPVQIHTVIADGVGLTYEQMYNTIKTNQNNTFFHDAEDELTI